MAENFEYVNQIDDELRQILIEGEIKPSSIYYADNDEAVEILRGAVQLGFDDYWIELNLMNYNGANKPELVVISISPGEPPSMVDKTIDLISNFDFKKDDWKEQLFKQMSKIFLKVHGDQLVDQPKRLKELGELGLNLKKKEICNNDKKTDLGIITDLKWRVNSLEFENAMDEVSGYVPENEVIYVGSCQEQITPEIWWRMSCKEKEIFSMKEIKNNIKSVTEFLNFPAEYPVDEQMLDKNGKINCNKVSERLNYIFGQHPFNFDFNEVKENKKVQQKYC